MINLIEDTSTGYDKKWFIIRTAVANASARAMYGKFSPYNAQLIAGMECAKF